MYIYLFMLNEMTAIESNRPSNNDNAVIDYSLESRLQDAEQPRQVRRLSYDSFSHPTCIQNEMGWVRSLTSDAHREETITIGFNRYEVLKKLLGAKTGMLKMVDEMDPSVEILMVVGQNEQSKEWEFRRPSLLPISAIGGVPVINCGVGFIEDALIGSGVSIDDYLEYQRGERFFIEPLKDRHVHVWDYGLQLLNAQYMSLSAGSPIWEEIYTETKRRGLYPDIEELELMVLFLDGTNKYSKSITNSQFFQECIRGYVERYYESTRSLDETIGILSMLSKSLEISSEGYKPVIDFLVLHISKEETFETIEEIEPFLNIIPNSYRIYAQVFYLFERSNLVSADKMINFVRFNPGGFENLQSDSDKLFFIEKIGELIDGVPSIFSLHKHECRQIMCRLALQVEDREVDLEQLQNIILERNEDGTIGQDQFLQTLVFHLEGQKNKLGMKSIGVSIENLVSFIQASGIPDSNLPNAYKDMRRNYKIAKFLKNIRRKLFSRAIQDSST